MPSPAQVAVTATSGGFSATVVVSITTPQGITVSPAVAAAAAGTLTTFTATGASGTVTWEVNGTAGGDGVNGTIDQNGNYTAPLTPPPGGSTVITAAAGGASGNATVTVVYSNASFNGTYAFSYSGDDGTGYLAVAGNFTATSASATITGVEDILDFNGLTSGQSVSGTFSIGPDGRGSVTLSPTQETWQIALSSSPTGIASEHALLINFGSIATTGFGTGSGTIDQQTTTTPPLEAGNYVFQLSGLDVNGGPTGVAGSFQSLGNGAITASGNVVDINDAGSAGSNTQNTTDDTSLTGSFIPSPGVPAAGTLTLTSTDIGEEFFDTTTGTLLFDFYIVSPNHIHLIETDGNAFLSGDVYTAPKPGNSGYTASLLAAGNYSFILGGATTNGAYGAGGVLISGGASSSTSTSGSITGGVFDNNAQNAQSQSDATIKSGGFTVDATTGRVTLSSIGTNQTSGTFDLVAYVTAQDPANPNLTPPVLLLETEANVIASGVAYLQSGAANPSGSFALNLTGVATAGDTEQDELAALNITSTGISGTMDINNAEAINNGIQLGVNISSTSSIVSIDSNGRGTAVIKAADGAVFQLAYYAVDPNTVVVLDTDSTRVSTGTMLKQF